MSDHAKHLVRDLMKRVALLARSHFDPSYLRTTARREFAKNKHLTDEEDIIRAVAYGRWMVREEQGRARFKRYRHLRERYSADALSSEFAHSDSHPGNLCATDRNGAGIGGSEQTKFNEAEEVARVRSGEEW